MGDDGWGGGGGGGGGGGVQVCGAVEIIAACVAGWLVGWLCATWHVRERGFSLLAAALLDPSGGVMSGRVEHTPP